MAVDDAPARGDIELADDDGSLSDCDIVGELLAAHASNTGERVHGGTHTRCCHIVQLWRM
jgi:hypothetical protein